MHYKYLFPSKYVAAADLLGQQVAVQIVKVVTEEVGQTKDVRPVLYFSGYQKGMVLNVTNAKRIVRMYGEDSEGWIGKTITLYESETEFAGETVPCIRVVDSTKVHPGLATSAAPQTRQISDGDAEDYAAMKAKLQAEIEALEAKKAGASQAAAPAAPATNPVEKLLSSAPNGQHEAAPVGGGARPRF